MARRAEGRCLGANWRSLVARRSPWPAALLAASILSSGFLLTQALDIDVTVEPSQKLLEGQNATLTPGGSADFRDCHWYRGVASKENQILLYIPPPEPVQLTTSGFTGRETAGPGCSLHIRNVSLSDNGTYTVLKGVRDSALEIGRVQIEVLEKLSPPTLWPAESIVEEHDNVTLNCTTSESSTVTVSWLKDGEPVPAKSVMFNRNQILVVPDVRKGDQGTYTCEARNPAHKATSNPSEIVLEFAGSPSFSETAAGAIGGIVLGCLAATALAGTLLYVFLRARTPKDQPPKERNPTSPVYENTRPSAQTQVLPENSSGDNHTYEELQRGRQSEYDQLKW